MKKRLLFVPLLAVLILAACGGKAAPTRAPESVVPMEAPAGIPPAVAPEAQKSAGQDASNAASESGVIYDTGAETASQTNAQAFDRMVIKNGEIKLLVKDSNVALDNLTQLVGDVGGYIVSSQVWYQEYNGENYKYTTVTIGVPADQFETALRRLRGLAVRVLTESASGEDVTDQYVDLASQLKNLEATRDRIQSFLDQAKTVDEALRINQQLSDIEAQIERVKGKMNYLNNRAAFSTIAVSIEPELPPIPPTPTPTMMPTPTPIPWDPGQTWDKSTKTLTNAYRGIADFFIWFFVALVPVLLPFAFIIWLVWKLVSRKPKA